MLAACTYVQPGKDVHGYECGPGHFPAGPGGGGGALADLGGAPRSSAAMPLAREHTARPGDSAVTAVVVIEGAPVRRTAVAGDGPLRVVDVGGVA